MDEEALNAFKKLEMRESIVRLVTERFEDGIISKEVFEAEMARISNRYRLTEKQQLAYDLYRKIQAEQQRRRKQK